MKYAERLKARKLVDLFLDKNRELLDPELTTDKEGNNVLILKLKAK